MGATPFEYVSMHVIYGNEVGSEMLIKVLNVKRSEALRNITLLTHYNGAFHIHSTTNRLSIGQVVNSITYEEAKQQSVHKEKR